MSKSKIKFKMDFVSSDKLNEKNGKSRIDFILNKVKDGTILVTDGVLKPNEEMDIIKETMRKVDDGFPGIEVCSLRRSAKGVQSIFEKMSDQKERLQNIFSGFTGGNPPKTSLKTGITLIGPAKVIRRIKKSPNSFSVFTEA